MSVRITTFLSFKWRSEDRFYFVAEGIFLKRFVAEILAFAFVLAGCSDKTGTPNIPVSPTDQVSISITNYYSFASRNEYSNYYDENTKYAWIDYMSLHSNTDFTLYDDEPKQAAELIANDEREGLVLLDSRLKIEELARTEKLLPLDDYLANNESWLSLPEEFRKTFEIGGEIYAIPYSSDNMVGSGLSLNTELAINTQWLKQLGLEMPKTLENFENVGKQFIQNDMNGDGIAGNDHLLGLFNPTMNAQILQAYGLYCDLPAGSTFGYDPELGCIADALFKDNAEPALAYLKRLYTEGVIDPDSRAYFNYDQIQNDVLAGKYGSILLTNAGALLEAGMAYAAENYQRITGKPFDPADKEVLQWAADVFEPVPPLSTQYPLTYSNSVYGYVMTAKTQMPNQVINRFVNLCYGLNSTTYLECNFGDGAYTLNSDGTCVVAGYNRLYGISIGTPERNACPNLGGYYRNSLGENFAVTSGTGCADYAKTLKGLKDKINDHIQKYEAINLMVEVPNDYAPGGEAYEESARMLRRDIFGKLYRGLMIGTQPIGDLLKTYREDALAFGVADVLQESNALLGLPNNQKLQ